MRNGGSERDNDLPMVTQTVSDRAGVGTQVIWILEPMFFLDCSLRASFFLFGLSFSNDLLNPFYVPVIVLRGCWGEQNRPGAFLHGLAVQWGGKRWGIIMSIITIIKREGQSTRGVWSLSGNQTRPSGESDLWDKTWRLTKSWLDKKSWGDNMESGATGGQGTEQMLLEGTSLKEQKEIGSTESRRKWYKDRLKREAGAL